MADLPPVDVAIAYAMSRRRPPYGADLIAYAKGCESAPAALRRAIVWCRAEGAAHADPEWLLLARELLGARLAVVMGLQATAHQIVREAHDG